MSTSAGVAKKTIKDLGFGFNEEGKLRQLDIKTGSITDKPFVFEVFKSRSENQKRYEALGEAITDFVYELLEENGLHRIYLPDVVPQSKAAFIFSTQKELKDVDKLMIIIHGSGVVRAGQWARSIIINHSLDAGTILPYLTKAKELGYEVIVTSTNDIKRDGLRIAGSGSPEEHAETVWKQIVQPANPKSIAIVAHSYGGYVATGLSKKFVEDFKTKVFAVALTDSVHGHCNDPRLIEIGINFVSSDNPMGTPESDDDNDMPRVSAGHPKHEMTSYACFEALFEFLQKRYELEREAGSPEAKKPKKNEEL